MIAIEIDSSNRGFLEDVRPGAAMLPGELDHGGPGPRGREHPGIGLEHDVVIGGQGVSSVACVPVFA